MCDRLEVVLLRQLLRFGRQAKTLDPPDVLETPAMLALPRHSVSKKKSRELLSRPSTSVQQILTRSDQVAQGLELFVRDRDPTERVHAQLPGEVACIALV